jgi:predicted nucleic acid-binding protein
VFIDTSHHVGLVDRKDQWHESARRVARPLPKRPKLTNLVVAEAVTIVGNRSGGKPARLLYDSFVDQCDVMFVNRALVAPALVQHTRFDGALSLADCATVCVMPVTPPTFFPAQSDTP